jgi:hypothetical protein
MAWDIFLRLGGGATSTAAQWTNYFTGFDVLKQKTLPDPYFKNLVDNFTVLTGPNDRAVFFGPSMNTNFGPSYSTSFDVVGYLINNYLPAPKPNQRNWKAVGKIFFGSGDIKLAFGPSTSLLYGGPGGSSKRGPYWERIAGEWWNPRGKGAKYSAEGSFKPQALGKGSNEGLQFFERDQILGTENNDGYRLAIMVKTGYRMKNSTIVNNTKNAQYNQWKQEEGGGDYIDVEEEKETLNDVKKDKYKSDLEKCFTNEEMIVLKAGDKAAKVGTVLILILDLIILILCSLLISKENYAGTFSADQLKKQKDARDSTKNDLETKKKRAEEERDSATEELEKAQNEKKEKRDAYDKWDKEGDPSKTSDPEGYNKELEKRKDDLDKASKQEEAKRAAKIAAEKKAKNAEDALQAFESSNNNPVTRDLEFNFWYTTGRLLYRLAKTVALGIMEAAENTERLARLAIENKDQMVDVRPEQYFVNKYMNAEKRCQINNNLINLATGKINADIAGRFEFTPRQIKEIGLTLLDIGKKSTREV